MKSAFTAAAFAFILFLSSCGSSAPKEQPVLLPSQGDARSTRSVIKVPYTEEGNVKIIPVKLNDTSMEMIFDTGASGVHISLLELQTLIKQGQITEGDFIGTTRSRIADGSVVENGLILLRKVSIADEITLTNVEASLARNQEAPLLLGNNVLNEFQSIEIDNVGRTINFRKR